MCSWTCKPKGKSSWKMNGHMQRLNWRSTQLESIQHFLPQGKIFCQFIVTSNCILTRCGRVWCGKCRCWGKIAFIHATVFSFTYGSSYFNCSFPYQKCRFWFQKNTCWEQNPKVHSHSIINPFWFKLNLTKQSEATSKKKKRCLYKIILEQINICKEQDVQKIDTIGLDLFNGFEAR